MKLKSLSFANGRSKILRAEEPTNIFWEGHDRSYTKSSFVMLTLLFLLTIVVILMTNYFITLGYEILSNKYESRCFVTQVSDERFNPDDVSLGCFCEEHF